MGTVFWYVVRNKSLQDISVKGVEGVDAIEDQHSTFRVLKVGQYGLCMRMFCLQYSMLTCIQDFINQLELSEVR